MRPTVPIQVWDRRTLCAFLHLRAGVGIGKGFIVAAVLSGIGTVLLGVLVYHERISGPALIGVVLGIVAIAFLAAGWVRSHARWAVTHIRWAKNPTPGGPSDATRPAPAPARRSQG